MASILIIDDSVEFRQMLRDMLESEGYEVSEANNGAEGLEAFQKNPVDIVFTDILMPEKDGIETICSFKKDFQDVKIIAMSGGGNYIKPEECLTAAEMLGAQKIMAKPFSRQELKETIAEVLNQNG